MPKIFFQKVYMSRPLLGRDTLFFDSRIKRRSLELRILGGRSWEPRLSLKSERERGVNLSKRYLRVISKRRDFADVVSYPVVRHFSHVKQYTRRVRQQLHHNTIIPGKNQTKN